MDVIEVVSPAAQLVEVAVLPAQLVEVAVQGPQGAPGDQGPAGVDPVWESEALTAGTGTATDLSAHRKGWYFVEAMGAGCSVVLPNSGAHPGDIARVSAVGSNSLAVHAVVQGVSGPGGFVATAAIASLAAGQSASFLNVAGMSTGGQGGGGGFLWKLIGVDAHSHQPSEVGLGQDAAPSFASVVAAAISNPQGNAAVRFMPDGTALIDAVAVQIAAAAVASFRAALGLGSAATAQSSDFAQASHSHPSSQISDATAAGRAILSAASAAAQRAALALGSAATADSASFAAASHSHQISGVTGLQAALDAKLNNGFDSTLTGVFYLARPSSTPSRIRGRIGTTTGIGSRTLVIDTQNSTANTYNENQLYLDGATGFVGVLKAPSRQLDVAGDVGCNSVVLAPSGAPAQPAAGMVYFSGDGHFYGHNGSAWLRLDNA